MPTRITITVPAPTQSGHVVFVLLVCFGSGSLVVVVSGRDLGGGLRRSGSGLDSLAVSVGLSGTGFNCVPVFAWGGGVDWAVEDDDEGDCVGCGTGAGDVSLCVCCAEEELIPDRSGTGKPIPTTFFCIAWGRTDFPTRFEGGALPGGTSGPPS